MDFTTSVMAELSALHDRLVMAKKLGVAKIVVELDAKVVVNLDTNGSKAKKSMERIVMECKNLLQDFEEYIYQQLISMLSSHHASTSGAANDALHSANSALSVLRHSNKDLK
ncbi:hypothetical protein CFP56_013717 [Quercus suber]|uniref:RNase H type-1 domain-containing protein n=1 Tax=Quercus suber TaxID=58331 RepID=A0AAW0KTL1_QUESU